MNKRPTSRTHARKVSDGTYVKVGKRFLLCVLAFMLAAITLVPSTLATVHAEGGGVPTDSAFDGISVDGAALDSVTLDASDTVTVNLTQNPFVQDLTAENDGAFGGVGIPIIEPLGAGNLQPFAEGVPYLDANGASQAANSVTIYSTGGSRTLASGWYLLRGTVSSAGTITISGNVHLILEDGSNWTAGGGVVVNAGNSLTIYAQSTGTSKGSLTAKGAPYAAGIGGSSENSGGTITINGGTINATGTVGADFPVGGAGIGGGTSNSVYSGGTITINGGTINATGAAAGAGIGGGANGAGGTITIGGATIVAKGGEGGAGIGGGARNSAYTGGTITISGGMINTTGGNYGAGIGGGSRGTGGTITISDGEITATAGNEGGSGIGGGLYAAGGTITIGGATIVAKGGAGGAGIGGGHQSAAGAASTITLNGGTVTATGGSGTPQGIGYGSAAGSATATVTINGGSVKASSISPTPKNSANTAVSLKTLTFNGISAVTAVTAGTIGGTACAAAPNAAGGIFGIKNVKTDTTGKVYFYLPQTSVPPVSLTIDAGVYENSNSANLSMLYLRASAPAPTVVEVTSSNVGVAGTITTTFSTAMDTATAGTVRLNDKVTLAGGSWSNGNKTYAVTYLGLDYSTTYNVSISGFKSAAGIEMVALPNAYSFTTAAKTAVTNTGGSATVVYNGSAIDLSTLSGLFGVDTNAGARTYTIETGGSATGVGTIGSDGKLTVTSAGTFTIGLATAETSTHAAGAKVTATLTVNKASQTAPTGLGKTDVTTYGGSDGTITGLAANTAYEYKKDAGSYTAATANASGVITGLTAGSYVLRLPATALYNASADSAAVVIDQPAASYGIELSVVGTHTFASETYGYSPVAAQSVTVTNIGNQATGALSVALSGADASSFELSSATLGGIAVGGTASLTVKPINNLTPKTYTATITASGNSNIAPVSFNVSFAVNKGSQTAPTGLGKTDVTTYGGSDGTITGLAANTAYEYKKDAGSYTAATANASGVITGLTAGSYVLRLPATALYNASADSAVVVIDQPAAGGGKIDGVPYIEANETPRTADNVTVFEMDGDQTLTSGWYLLRDTHAGALTINGDVNIILEDKSNWTADGVIVNNGNSLTVYAQSIGTSKGSLTATGGYRSAGIGGSDYSDGGTITINGGAITATGGDYGAGIGGGSAGGAGGTIAINGGMVIATSGGFSAGIGGGYQGAAGTITISSGAITATGDSFSAGIGGGEGAAGGTITIIGGTITATGGYSGAGIGGGYHGAGGTISIGDGTVIATGGNWASGIGGGAESDGGTITIEGGIITATGGTNAGTNSGAGIGGGYQGAGGTIAISGGEINAAGGVSSAGIGGGQSGAAGTITINGGTLVAAGTSGGAGIGSGWNGVGGTITIDGGSVNASSVAPAPLNSAGNPVLLRTFTFDGLNATTAVTAGTIDGVGCNTTPDAVSGVYGIRDVKTNTTGKVYFYLPQTSVPPVSLTISAGAYGNSNPADPSMLYLGAPAFTPTVVEVTSNSVGLVGTITITFNMAMDTATVGSVQLNSSVTIAGGMWSNGDKTCTVTYIGLDYDTTYNVSISGFKSAAGIEMVALPNAYSFTTAAKTAVTNTGGSATVTYSGGAIDLSAISGLFSVDTNAGARTYTIETSGSATGTGTIDSDGKLTVTSAGTFTIGLATAETSTHAAGAKVTATLTVNKGSQTAPTGLAKTDVTTYGGSDGTITGLAANTAYEYKKDAGSYTAATANASGVITGLTAGSYVLRLPATALYNASADSAEVVIGQPSAGGGTINGVPYIEADETPRTADNVTLLDADGDQTLTSGWYLLRGTHTGTLTISGDANFILEDGSVWTAGGGVIVNAADSLTIYAQSVGASKGSLTAKGGDESAGIGGSNGNSGGTITINGGTVTARGGGYATPGVAGAWDGAGGAGIGGGKQGTGGTITINGGIINATSIAGGAGIGGGGGGIGGTIAISGGTIDAKGGANGAGIGGGIRGAGGTITINSGEIRAMGGSGEPGVYGGAGIGGGYLGDGGTITMNGGTINAIGGSQAASIGGGCYGTGGTITISGGTINAIGGSQAASIGGGCYGTGGTITISGGTINATTFSGGVGIGDGSGTAGGIVTIDGGSVKASSVSPAALNSEGDPVLLRSFTFDGLSVVTAVTAGTIDGVVCDTTPDAASGIYGINDVNTDATGKVYFYLPQASVPPVSLTIGAGTYENSNPADPSTLYLGVPAFAPTVVEITSSNVGASGTITVTFSTAMDIATAGTVQLNSLVTLTGGAWLSKGGDTVYVVPYVGLDYSTTYNVSISGFKSAAGIEMVALPNAYSFTTAAKTAVTNTGGSATVVYNGSAIDLSTLSGLFSVDTNAGARTYTIETGGSATGAGTIGSDGKLTVTSAGTFTIGLATAETGTHAAGAKVTATLTVNKANIIVTGVAATKEYDGSPDFSAAQIDIRGAMLTGNFDGTNLMLLKTGVRGSLTSANAGTSGYLSLTDAFALGGSAAGNYTMVMQPAVSASITKATSGLAANPSPLKAYVTLGTSGNASVDLGAIALLAAHSYGTSSYALGTFDAGDGVVTAAPALSGTTLTYSYNTTSSALGSTSTQAVTITTTNYADISVNVVFEVTNKASVTIGGVSFAAKTYDGTPVVPTGTATVTPAWSTLPLLWHYAGAATDGTTYSESGTDVSLPAAPTKAGSYSLRISTDPADAVTGETTINFTINKATLTFKADDKTITAGASVPTYTYTLSGLASGDTAAEVVRTAPTPVCVGDMNTAGTYDITVSGAVLTSGADAKGANYEVAYASGTLTVNAAPPAGGGGDDGGSDGGDGSGSGSGDGSGGTTTPPTTVIITPPASTNTPNVTTAPTTSPDPVTSEGSAQTNTGGSSTLPASETPLAAAAETGGFPWLILVIGGLAVVIVATGVILLGKRKKV